MERLFVLVLEMSLLCKKRHLKRKCPITIIDYAQG